jgi:large subunit ribosomal protein L35
MPKLKTHRGAKKRFKISGTGKITYKISGQRHLLTGMSAGRGRHMRKRNTLNATDAKVIHTLLP